MASSFLRLRRALTFSSSVLNHRFRPLSALASAPALPNPRPPAHPFARTLSFRSSPVISDRRDFDDGGKISPDEILFEGCDYNHWLITMDFPKDPKPTAEEMVETYVQTAAKVFGSVEEAKRRIYACSTTTYKGFQAVMDEETSEKFRGLPGVVFILPDSYIDPVNKEYGGDKYENGVITPRPPPVQYGRQGRYGDRNRNYDRPRYDRPRDSMQQGNMSQDGRGYAQEGGRDFGAGRRDGYQGNNSAPGNFPPQERRNFPLGQGGNFPPQEQRNSPQGQGGNFPPPKNIGIFHLDRERDSPLKNKGTSHKDREETSPLKNREISIKVREEITALDQAGIDKDLLRVMVEITDNHLPQVLVENIDRGQVQATMLTIDKAWNQIMQETLGKVQVLVMNGTPLDLLKDNGRQSIDILGAWSMLVLRLHESVRLQRVPICS